MKSFPYHNIGKHGLGMKFGKVLLASALMLAPVSGCTPKSSSVSAAPEEVQAPAGDAFSVAVSRMQPGEQSVMPTPFGQDSLVMVEGVYTSGLGQTCRRATVQALGGTHRVAVCRDETGWFTAGPVFENVQR